MTTYIVTGNYTSEAMHGMLANPSDRAAAVKPMVEAAGGKMLAYYATMGPSDFMMITESDDFEGVCAALMVAGSAGSVSNLCSYPAISAGDFQSVQKRAGKITGAYKPPS